MLQCLVREFLLPPTEKRKQFELRALGLREFAGVTGDQALDPFALARFANLLVVDFDDIQGLSAESREHLLGEGSEQWSGGACSLPLPNGGRLVILNPAHGKQRNRATLMEEISHVFLGHKANRLAILGAGGNRSSDAASEQMVNMKKGAALARDYNHDDEEEAYAVGSAALVPYAGLRRFVAQGRTADQIARHFRVSRQLVEYRIKVTHLWSDYKSASASRVEHV